MMSKTAPPQWEACVEEEKFRSTPPEPCGDSYLNLYETGGRPTRAVLATFRAPRSGGRCARDPRRELPEIRSTVQGLDRASRTLQGLRNYCIYYQLLSLLPL